MREVIISSLALALLVQNAHAASGVCEAFASPVQAYVLRTATILNIKVYELKIYALEPFFSFLPACYEIHYLRDFEKGDVDKAWDYQFKESADYKYSSLGADIIKLKSFFSQIKDERNHSFVLLKNKTQVFENGKLKGIIPGTDFQKSFLSIWTGKNPPTIELQKELFKKMKL